MKIRVSTIPPEGLTIEVELSLEALNHRMHEGRETDITFTKPPNVSLTVFKTVTGAETRGKVRCAYRQPCSRCLESIEQEVTAETNFVLAQRPGDQPQQAADDIGIVYFEGDYVDLEETIQEALILRLSLYWHPPSDDKGNCLQCGLNIDQQLQELSDKPATFADLLKVASTKN